MSVLLAAPEGKFDEVSTFILEMAGAGDFAFCPGKSVEGIKPRSLKSQISTSASM